MNCAARSLPPAQSPRRYGYPTTALRLAGATCSSVPPLLFASPRARVRFLQETMEPAYSPLQGQMIVGLGVDFDRFCDNFASMGPVLRGA